MVASKAKTALPTLLFARQRDFAAWVAKHEDSPGVWLKLAKKGAREASLSYAEAVEVALCYGWIDGQKQALDAEYWLQKFTPRTKKSIWSKINREKAEALLKSQRVTRAGLLAIEAAKADGRWAAAYDSAKKSEVPADLEAALAKNKKAREFFATLDAANRYAILFRLQTAKKAETRERRLTEFVAMLARGEKIHG